MNQLVDLNQQVRSNLPWLAKLQTEALTVFKAKGLPTRHDEDWKYTSVDALSRQAFKMPLGDAPKALHTLEVPVQQTIVIHNGHIEISTDLLSKLPSGVVVCALSQALTEHESLVKPYLGQILQQEHGFHALNTALISSGIFIYLPKGVRVEDPLALVHFQDQGQQAVSLRHLIIAEEESELTLLEDYQGDQNTVYFTNTVSEVCLGARARLTHYKIQRESPKAFHLGHIAVKQAAHSTFSSHSLSLGGALVRSDLSIKLQEEYASCLMNGIYVPTEGQHIDHHTKVHHLVPHCSSEQDYKGIMQGRSRAVFNGTVYVAKDAQHTDAKQQNKNLLLSAQAEIDTKPQLEIFADDVLCSHGATVGQLDEDALFYLATRGIGRIEASQYLIQAFAQDNLALIPHAQLAKWMGSLLINQLG
jgi:Fe-S cluster assembly protein SufD